VVEPGTVVNGPPNDGWPLKACVYSITRLAQRRTAGNLWWMRLGMGLDRGMESCVITWPRLRRVFDRVPIEAAGGGTQRLLSAEQQQLNKPPPTVIYRRRWRQRQEQQR
jgi:hypothetical protein